MLFFNTQSVQLAGNSSQIIINSLKRENLVL